MAMSKTEAVTQFKQGYANIWPKLEKDKPMMREAWNNWVDELQKNGSITERQASTWTQPDFCA